MAKMRTFFSEGRQFRISLSILIAIIVAIIITLKSDHTRESLITRGDFPGLLVQGIILSRGEGNRLYDFEYQREIENQIWPSFNGGLYVSVYPPYHAFLMRPFAGLNPLLSQTIFISIMILALISTLMMISKLNQTGLPSIFVMCAISLSFPPLFFGILGAQNTALSMLFYCSALYLSKNGTRFSEIVAGIALGAWLFKPQFALFGIATAVLMWRIWILFGASLVAAIYYYLAAIIMGPLWIIEWIKATSVFSLQNYLVNGSQMTSLIATIKMFIISLGFNPESAFFDNISLVAHAFVLLTLAYLMMRLIALRIQNKVNFYQSLLILGPIITLFSPNTLFYDLGIALVPLFIVANFESDNTYWKGLIIWGLLGILVALRGTLTIPFYFLFALFVTWKVTKEALPLYRSNCSNSRT